jgi:hypothetical protein
VLHRTRTDLSKWFVAAYLMGRDKRGVSAKFSAARAGGGVPDGVDHGAQVVASRAQRGPHSSAARLSGGDETFIGGRGDPTSRGRSTANPDKSLVVAAVEKVPAPQNPEPAKPPVPRSGALLLGRAHRSRPCRPDRHDPVGHIEGGAPVHAKVTAWLDKHPRFHLHFTPTSAWLNQVERFFGLITHDRIRRGVFTSVPELEAAIHDYLDHHNAHPKPFVWTKSAEEILAKVSRARRTLETVAQGNQVINSVH